MQRKAILGLAVVVLAGLGVYWFGVRDRGAGKPKAAATASEDPWAKPPVERKRAEPRDQPERASNDGAMPRLAHEVDPVGSFVLEGQVLDEDEHAVAGAVVRISSSPPRTTTTNATGEFTFDKLLGRTYALTARSGDRIGGPVTAKGSSKDPVVIRLRQGATLTVSVTDGKKPVAGARVLLLDEEDLDETTNDDGVATFRAMDAGWTRVAVTAKGFSPGSGTARIGKGEKQAKLEIALVKGAPVSGKVVDDAGKAVAGARVWPVDAANAWAGGAGDRAAVTSAADGTFTIPALAAGSWILQAKDDTHAPASTRPITVSGEVPTTGIEIVLPAAAVIAGIVVDGAGAPVPDASVQLSSDRWSTDMIYRQAAADADGHFEIRALPRTSFKVRATSDDATSDAIAVDVTGKAEKRDVKLVLDHAGTISGVVVDSNNEAVAEAEVSAAPDFLSGNRGDNDWILAGGDTATTDGDGRFVVRGLDAGNYRLFAVRDAGGVRRVGQRAGVVAKVGDKDVRLVLPSPGTIVGKVVLESGSPPARATITAGWENRTTTTDGTFRLTEVAPMTYDVRVSGSEFGEQVKRDVVVEAGKEVDLGTIIVRPGRKVAGKVVDGKGAPVEGATVYMGQLLFGDGKKLGTGSDDGTEQPGVRKAISNAQGEFVLIGVSRSGGALVADHPVRGRSVSIDIPAGKDDVRGVTVPLLGFGSVAGKVTRKGEPVAGATVSAAPTGASGQAVFVSAGADGSFVFDKLPAGRTTLLAMNMGMMRASSGGRAVVVTEGQQVDGSIELPVGDISVTVHCKAKPGQVVSGAQVFLFHGNVSPATGLAVSNLFLARRGVPAETLPGGADQSDVGVAAGMSFWLGTGDPKFDEVVPGAYSLCAIPFTGQITDPQLMERVMRNLDKLAAVCMPLAVAAQPKTVEVTFELPAMAPLPEDAE